MVAARYDPRSQSEGRDQGGVPGRMKVTARLMKRSARAFGKALWALADQKHPVLAHIIPMRRCNLSCTYCNEYDAAPSRGRWK